MSVNIAYVTEGAPLEGVAKSVAGHPSVAAVVLAPTAHVAQGHSLEGYAMVLKGDGAMDTDLFNDMTLSGDIPLAETTGMYEIPLNNEEGGRLDVVKVRAGLNELCMVFAKLGVDAVRHDAAMTIHTVVSVNDLPFVSHLCCDKEHISVVEGQYNRAKCAYLIVQSHIKSLTEQMREYIGERAITVSEWANSDVVKNVTTMNKVHNQQIAAQAATVLGIPIATMSYGGRTIGTPHSIWQSNIIHMSKISTKGVTDVIPIFYQNTYCTERTGQRGMIYGVSPLKGYQWYFSPSASQTASKNMGGGPWSSQKSLHMFPRGTGRNSNWKELSIKTVSASEQRLIKQKVRALGGREISLRLHPDAYRDTVNSKGQRELMSKLGADSTLSMELVTEALLMGELPAGDMKIAAALRWMPESVTQVAVRLDDPLIGVALREYVKEKGDGGEGIFQDVTVRDLFERESANGQALIWDRAMVEKLVALQEA